MNAEFHEITVSSFTAGRKIRIASSQGSSIFNSSCHAKHPTYGSS